MGNIIGEPINGEILKQVKNRQKLQGAGYNSESVKRDPEVLNYLNNRNAWIKMASGVAIEGSIGKQKLKDIFAQSPDQTITESEYANLQGTGLAENLVLFNTIQSFNDNKYTPRSGVRNTNFLKDSTNKMYGGLGDNSQGLLPIGGITGITIEDVNRGSVRKAKVNIKVYNRFQFNLVELLYLRLGYLMILEWGWDKYVSNIENIPGNPPKVTIEPMGSTIIEEEWFTNSSMTQRSMLSKIQKKRLETQGNYDAFFGKVSNFTWSLNTDGSFNISIDLITLGSVIESQNVKPPAIQLSESVIDLQKQQLSKQLDVEINEDTTYDNSLINNVGTNILSQFLGKTILNFPKNNSNYVDLNILSKDVGAYKEIAKNGSYYIRLGTFLETMQSKVFPIISDDNTQNVIFEKILDIDTGLDTNICNYVLNLVPLDPTICIFGFEFSKDFQRATYLKNAFNNGNIQPFVVREGNVVYGKIMNLYMNFNFLQTALESNINEKNELSLYQYLEDICKGINSCTGNTTNIEPTIKNDRTVYFLEQNPIKGYDSKRDKTDTVPFEILGYNSNGESNFVSDFKFNTKITPDLMTTISIGSGGGKNAESLPFNKWNDGLKNRFEKKVELEKDDKDEIPILEEGLTPRAEILAQFEKDMYEDKDSWFAGNVDYDSFTGYDWEWKTVNINDIDPPGWDGASIFSNQIEDSKDPELRDEVVRRVHELEIELKRKKIRLVDRTAEDEDGNLLASTAPVGEEYLQYIIQGFGGNTGLYTNGYLWGYNKVEYSKREGIWWDSVEIPSFIERGKDAFKTYINTKNVDEYERLKVNSSLSGFIPVELSLTVEGLSGIKIYNKLNINQKFLPPAYPDALKFLIRGVNHKIDNNNWTTEISTISTSITDQTPTEEELTPDPPNILKTPLDPIKKVVDDDQLKKSLIKGLSLTADTSTGLIYYPEETTKTQITLHHTAVTNAKIETIVRNWTKLNSKVSTHFIINRNGDYDQLFPLKYWGNHIGSSRKGNSKLQKSTISIELEGAGYLNYIDGSGKNLDGTFTNSAEFRQNQKTYKYTELKGSENDIAVTQPVTMNSNGSLSTVANYRNSQYYHAYTTKQLDVLRQILQKIRSEYPNIPIGSTFNGAGTKFSEQFPSSGVQSEAAFSFNPGVYTHNSYRTDKSDVFPQKELIELLQEFN